MLHTMPNESAAPYRRPLLWEQHCCLPLERRADVGELARYRGPGGGFVSVSVGYAVTAILGGNFHRVATLVWQ
ncbi:hypothetical protein [Streptomyces sp. NPDC047043]|uniref:hypothetical protein n=1 Tax=Streptomyces sp. NPDC047043 TaxID=3154497 RepID=UPI0033FB4A83